MYQTILRLGLLFALMACDEAPDVDAEKGSAPFVVDTVATYGSAEGPLNEVFGLVQHAAPGDDGRLYAVDDFLKLIRVVEQSNLRHVVDFGGPGPGPLEFQSPMGIASLPGGRIVVGDAGRTFKVLDFATDSAVLVSTFTTPFKADDFCSLDGELFIRGWNETGLIHKVSPAGEALGSFGHSWQSENPLTRQERSEGVIGCHDDADVVVAMFHFDPRIFAYSADGDSLWVSRIPDYHQARIEEGTTPTGRPSITFFDDPPHDMAASIVPFGSDQLLIQVALITTVDDVRTPVFRMYMVSVHDGHVRPVADRVPLLLSADAPRLFMAEIMPFPRLVAVELREVGQ